jgi:peptidoglycan/LPS O-acetylase OafA/YrhL
MPSNSNSNNYVPYLDGMRGIAILFVILAHLGLGRIIPGGLGVSLFFFISGLLITRLLIAEYDKTQSINLKSFYIRRVLRLYPPLLLMTVLTIILICIYYNASQIHVPAVLSSLFYFYNYYYTYFKPATLTSFDNLFDISWSLSIEEHFYLVFPLLFYFLYAKKNVLIRVLLTICVLTLAYRYYLLYTSHNVKATINLIYVVTETRVDSIIWGCIASLLIYKNKNKYYLKLLQSNWALVLGLATILLSLLYKNTLFSEASRFTKQALAFFLIVPSINYYGPGSIIKRFFENSVLTYIGKISYSLYLFHWEAITVANYYFKEGSPQWLIFTLVLTVILSLGCYYLIERPFMSLRHKFGSHAK